MYNLNLDIVLTVCEATSILSVMKSRKKNIVTGPKVIAMARVQRMDLVPSLNALTLILVAASTAFYMLMLGL